MAQQYSEQHDSRGGANQTLFDDAAFTRVNSSLPGGQTAALFLLQPGWAPPAWEGVSTAQSDRMIQLLREPLSSLSTILMQLAVAMFTADNYPHIM